MTGLVVAVLPDAVHRRLTTIVDRVERNGTGCRHLERTGTGYLCVQHPHIVRCLACAATHVDCHTWVEEFTCDVCGKALDRGGDAYLGLCNPVEIDTTVSLGRGRRAAIGIVVAFGWGACSACSTTLAVSS
ncbi:MAG: hypothetical protein H0U21_02185 [Acidimicrobiia bacterium]|nr:hypothetical protein [Acidimicrobiia bacterium]